MTAPVCAPLPFEMPTVSVKPVRSLSLGAAISDIRFSMHAAGLPPLLHLPFSQPSVLQSMWPQEQLLPRATSLVQLPVFPPMSSSALLPAVLPTSAPQQKSAIASNEPSTTASIHDALSRKPLERKTSSIGSSAPSLSAVSVPDEVPEVSPNAKSTSIDNSSYFTAATLDFFKEDLQGTLGEGLPEQASLLSMQVEAQEEDWEPGTTDPRALKRRRTDNKG